MCIFLLKSAKKEISWEQIFSAWTWKKSLMWKIQELLRWDCVLKRFVKKIAEKLEMYNCTKFVSIVSMTESNFVKLPWPLPMNTTLKLNVHKTSTEHLTYVWFMSCVSRVAAVSVVITCMNTLYGNWNFPKSWTVWGFEPCCSHLNVRFCACLSKEFLGIQATIECVFTLKRVHDMRTTYS